MNIVKISVVVLAVSSIAAFQSAQAGPLPALSGNYYVGQGISSDNISSSTPGSGSLSSCWGNLSASALGGSNPEVSVAVSNLAVCDGDGGGDGDAVIDYYFEVTGSGSTATVDLSASASIAANGSSANDAQATLIVIGSSDKPYATAECLTNCLYGASATEGTIGDTTFSVNTNEQYEVELRVDEAGYPSGGASASLNAFVALDAADTGDTIAYSDGVGPLGVPEPASLSLFVAALAGLVPAAKRRHIARAAVQ